MPLPRHKCSSFSGSHQNLRATVTSLLDRTKDRRTSLQTVFCMTSITGPSCEEDARLRHSLQIVLRRICERCGCGFRARPSLYDVKLLQLSRVLVVRAWSCVQTSQSFVFCRRKHLRVFETSISGSQINHEIPDRTF